MDGAWILCEATITFAQNIFLTEQQLANSTSTLRMVVDFESILKVGDAYQENLEAGREEVATVQSRNGVVLQFQPFKRVETRKGTLPECVSVKTRKSNTLSITYNYIFISPQAGLKKVEIYVRCRFRCWGAPGSNICHQPASPPPSSSSVIHISTIVAL